MTDGHTPEQPPEHPEGENNSPPPSMPEIAPADERTQGSGVPSPDSPRLDWKADLKARIEKLKQSDWARNLGMKIQTFEPIQAAEWASRTFQRQDAGAYGKALTIGLCAFFLADLAALLIGKYIPEPPVSRVSHLNSGFRRAKTIDDYNVIFSRNLFNSQGIIPGEENQGGLPTDNGGPPVRTSLPFNLIGTVILQDEALSIATIEDKSATMVYPVREQDEIPAKAKILKIEPRKVTFINTSSGRREFIDLPEEPNAYTPRINVATGGGKTAGPGIEKVSATQYNIQRGEVDKALADLNNVLTQARAVPNFENGVPSGYKLFQIVPGSIYDKLGLQNGDVISGLNGEPINDPGKAFQMLSELKTSNHLELQVKKDGKVQTNQYDIR